MFEWVFFIPVIVGFFSVVLSLSLWYFFLKPPVLEEAPETLTTFIYTGTRRYLQKQYRAFFLVFSLILSLIVLDKFHLVEYRTILIPMGLVLGLFVPILTEFYLNSILCRSLKLALFRVEHHPDEARRIVFLGPLAGGFGVAGIILMTLTLWFYTISVTPVFTNLQIIFSLMAPCFSCAFYMFYSRLCSGVFAKAADLSADVTGRTEYDLPEDDLRNPASIADMVGDFLSMISISGVLGYTLMFSVSMAACIRFIHIAGLSTVLSPQVLCFTFIEPLWIVCVGVSACLVIFPLLRISFVLNKTGVVLPIVTLFAWILSALLPATFSEFSALGLGLNFILLIGVLMWIAPASPFLKSVTEAHKVHAINGFFSGFAHAIFAAWVPILGISVMLGTQLGYFMNPSTFYIGIYHLGLMSVGMLSIFPAIMMLGGFAPVADTLKGCVVMLSFSPEVIKTAEKMDSDGTLASAMIKSFLITSGSITGLLLSTVYLFRLYFYVHLHTPMGLPQMDATHIAQMFDLYIIRPSTWGGIILGAFSCFLLIGGVIMGVQAISRTMTEDIRRQCSQTRGLWDGTALPDYQTLIDKASRVTFRRATIPIVMVFILPIITTWIDKTRGGMGLMVTSIILGFIFGHVFNYCGALWRGCKKQIERNGNIQSSEFVASIFTNAIGDIFKDALAPTFPIMVHLLGYFAILAAALSFKFY